MCFFLVLYIIIGRVGFFFRIRFNFKMKLVFVDWKDLDLNVLNEIIFKDFKKKLVKYIIIIIYENIYWE